MKIKDKFIQVIKDNQRGFSIDRAKSLGASETFACIRRGWFSKHKPELADPISNWGVLERGNVMENHFAVPKLQAIFGADNCLFMGGDQETFVLTTSSATPDGLVINQPRDVFADDGLPDILSNCFTSEIKSFDPRMNIREEKFIHRGQTIMQMGQIRHHTDYRPEFACLLYINASDYGDIHPFFIRYTEDEYQRGRERAEKVFNTKDVHKLFAEGKHTDQCRYCPYTSHCNAADISVFPSNKANYTSNEIGAMRSLAQEHVACSDEIKKMTVRKGAVSDAIKAALVEMQSKGIEDVDFKVTYAKMAGKESVDKAALSMFLARHGKTYDDFTKQGEDFTRLTVTVRESDTVDKGI